MRTGQSGVRVAGPVAPTPRAVGTRRRAIGFTDTQYLWLLVILEVAAHGWLRHWSRSHHGG